MRREPLDAYGEPGAAGNLWEPSDMPGEPDAGAAGYLKKQPGSDTHGEPEAGYFREPSDTLGEPGGGAGHLWGWLLLLLLLGADARGETVT